MSKLNTIDRLIVATIIFVLVMILTSCTNPLDVQYTNHRPMDPIPANYRELYTLTEQCVDSLGLPNRGNWEDVRWFVADSIVHNGRTKGGTTILPGHDITMWTNYVSNDFAVRHEMSHQITQLGNEIHTDGGIGTVCDGWIEYVNRNR